MPIDTSDLLKPVQNNKPWYSALNTLQLPTATVPSNRISPLVHGKRISSSPSLIKYTNEASPLKHLLKKMTRTPSSAHLSPSRLSLKKKDELGVIYMKSPHVVANGELAGTLVIQHDTVIEFKLVLKGVEAVIDSQHRTTKKQHEFLNLPILNISSSEIESFVENKVMSVPFLIMLPANLSGTFVDKKGSVQYHLESEIKSNQETHTIKKPVLVYPNVASLKSLKDVTDLYLPINENNKLLWKSLTSSVTLDVSLSRTVWMSGAPIYISVKIHNTTIDTVSDMKLELLRKQNTCLFDEDDSVIPVTSSCEIISKASLAKSGWWQALEPNTKDHVTMMIDTPLNQVTVRNQKLIDVSFSIRMLICSLQRTDTVVEIPIMLVHPIAMDPPPPLLTKKEEIPILKKVDHAAKPSLLQSPSSHTYSSASIKSSNKAISLTSQSSNRSSPIIRKEAATPTINNNTKLKKMKKSISTWGTHISRKISMTRINEHQSPSNKMRPTISSPIISNPSVASCNESIASSNYSSPSSSRQKTDISSLIHPSNTQRSMMKFGEIKGPKRFGQQPGCLGDAGLDIRNCFNVSKATEVMQSYAAEKVEIPDGISFIGSSDDEEDEDEEPTPTDATFNYPPYLEPVQLSEANIRWKEGFVAPPEKCELDMTMIEEESRSRKSSIQDGGNHPKRMMASSRHLINVQRKSAQVSKNGRPMLALPSSAI